jgi:tetratricopeptide (TPR) repeat protein
MARQYDSAIQQLRNTLEMDSSYELPHLVLGLAYVQKGDFVQAIPELRKAADLAHSTPLMVSALANAYARMGNRLEAEKLLANLVIQSKMSYVSPYYFAVVHAGLGDQEKAISDLEKAYSDRSNGLVFLKVDPALDALRADARFQLLQQKLNFPSKNKNQ